MNKQQQLTKQVTKSGILAIVVACVFAIVFYAANQFNAAAHNAKVNAENALSADMAKMASFTSQIDKSGDAVKRFISIEQARDNLVFAADIGVLSNWFKQAKQQYRFSDALAISIAPERPNDKSDLQTLDYTVTLRPDMEIKNIEAMSDIHIFSFLQEFMRHANGLVSVSHVKLSRKADLNPTALAQIQSGVAPVLIEGEIRFDWVGIVRKQKPEPAGVATGGTP